MTATEQGTLTYHCPHCQAAVTARPEAGQAVACPACQKPFEAALPVARPEASAPEGILLPPGVAPPEAPPVAQPAAPAAAPPETAGELIRVSTWRRYPARCSAYTAGFVGFAALGIWLLVLGHRWLALGAGLVALSLLARFGLWLLRMRCTTLTITDRRCVIETGVFGRQATEIGRKDVTDVFVAQDPIMRVLDVGDLVIRSDSGAQKEVVLMAVPHPEEVAKKIQPTPTPPQPA